MRTMLALLLALAATAHAGITTREVAYPAGNVTAKGFLALPGTPGKHPGILVVHEFWGLNDYARQRAKMLAKLGYAALAVDMYGGGKVAGHPQDAMAFMNAVTSDLPEAQRRFEAALKFLQDQPEVNPGEIAAIGYCFGGGIVLQMACDGLPGLQAVASFHGSLGAQVPEGAQPTARVLVCAGGSDQFAPPATVAAFKERLKKGNVHFTFVSYPGAQHGFTNPDATALGKKFGLPIAYDATADQESWGELQEFLKSVFKS